MTITSINTLLQNKDKFFLCWDEPWPGKDENLTNTTCSITLKATVADCIRIQRLKDTRYVDLPEEEILLDFISVNWAYYSI